MSEGNVEFVRTSTSRGCSIEILRSSWGSRRPTLSTSILPMRSNRVCAAGSSLSRRPCAASPRSGRNPATSSGSCTTVGTLSWLPWTGPYAAGEASGSSSTERRTPGPCSRAGSPVRVGAGSRDGARGGGLPGL